MDFNLTALSLTYPLFAGFLFCVGFILGLKRDNAVLQETVRLHKENQDKINAQNDSKFQSIDSKLNQILTILIEK